MKQIFVCFAVMTAMVLMIGGCGSDPCYPNPCNHAGSTVKCNATSATEYICECENDYYWWGQEKGCQDTRPTLGNICTGQTSCYGAYYKKEKCPVAGEYFFGQDAQYTNKCTAQSFTVQTISDQKVVLDNNTGLMWQQTIPTDTYTWVNAFRYCRNLTYAGYDDWRLPNPQEFLTIVDNSRKHPAIDTTYFPNIYDDHNWSYVYWSSKSYGKDEAQYFEPYDGSISYYPPYGNINYSSLNRLVCVRGNELPNASFTTKTIKGKVVVTDSNTGLMWQKEFAEVEDWQEALQYCEYSTYAGYNNWRLPNKNELASLINYDKSKDPLSDFPDMQSNYFWSSTTDVYVDAYGMITSAWYVFFDDGRVGSMFKKIYDDLHPHVMCVR